MLTIKHSAESGKIKSIVLPVRSFVPVRKIELLEAVTGKNKPAVHLITMHNKENKTNAFIDTYRTISEDLHYHIEYKILEGNNFPRAIFNYANQIKADIIFANPYTETRINSFYGTDICNLISPASKLSIFTAEPFHS